MYGQNLPYKFKKSYGDFQNRNFEKPHRTTAWSPVRFETGSVILSKFWSSYIDLQNFRKRNFLGDDQGELSKGTVCEPGNRKFSCSRRNCTATGHKGSKMAQAH